ALRYSEKVLAILRAGGVPDMLAVAGQHLLIAVVNGFTLDETSPQPGPGGQPAEGGNRGGAPQAGQPGDDAGAAPPPSHGDPSRYLASLPPGPVSHLTRPA